MMPAICLAGLK